MNRLYPISCNSTHPFHKVVLEICHDGSEDEHKLLGISSVPDGISIEALLDSILNYVHFYYTPEEIKTFKYGLIEQIVFKD